MALFLEISDGVMKQVALLALRYPDKPISSIIEECIIYGAQNLSGSQSQSTVQKNTGDLFNSPVLQEDIDRINNISSNVAIRAQEEADSMVVYSEDEAGDALSSLGEAIYNDDGSIEL